MLFLLLTVFSGAGAANADDCVKPDWKVDSVRLPQDPHRAVTTYVELGDVIAVKSANLAALRECAAKQHTSVLLYLNGFPLKGTLESPASPPASDEANYQLQINSENRTVWNGLLGSPTPGATSKVEVSLGLANGYAIPTTAEIALRPLPPAWFAAWGILFIGGLIAFFVLAAKTTMIRGGTPTGGQVFSMSRSQAAWWFFLVLAAYLLIGLTTGDYANSLNQTALTLLGIASATYLGSAAVDASKNTPAVQQGIAAETARINAIAEADRTPAEKDKLPKLRGESQGWLKDVLSDSEGIDFHRFQMLAWTVVLGIIFITRVWHDLAMPEFSATLLGLMGLSSGTYVGLKIQETTK